eukprot:SAG31_NODE_8648_length_1414_cov_1.313308_1_plen_40_part_10
MIGYEKEIQDHIGSECGQLGQKIPLNYTGIVFLKYLEGAD